MVAELDDVAAEYASALETEEDMDHLIDDNDRLEPCPFCGAEAEIIKIDGEIDAIDTGALCVQCTACGASSALIYPLMDDATHLLMELWNKRRTASKPDTDLADDVSKAMRRAWYLGQEYWRLADSESYRDNMKSDEIGRKFEALMKETRYRVWMGIGE